MKKLSNTITFFLKIYYNLFLFCFPDNFIGVEKNNIERKISFQVKQLMLFIFFKIKRVHFLHSHLKNVS